MEELKSATILPFGKYKGLDIHYVLKIDKNYLVWCYENLDWVPNYLAKIGLEEQIAEGTERYEKRKTVYEGCIPVFCFKVGNKEFLNRIDIERYCKEIIHKYSGGDIRYNTQYHKIAKVNVEEFDFLKELFKYHDHDYSEYLFTSIYVIKKGKAPPCFTADYETGDKVNWVRTKDISLGRCLKNLKSIEN